ncbi:hypothetical protein [Streptodolium elevatio]|uniref:Uncharacterized protein n=1 Tax=Streptodolium elevatio TaxID=3157996 RepID=A0ABV3DGU5_9ACTN
MAFVYRCAATAAAVVLATVPASAVTATPAGERHAVGEQFSFRLHEAVRELPLAQESRDGYVRTKFKHWVDADKVIWSEEGQMAS